MPTISKDLTVFTAIYNVHTDVLNIRRRPCNKIFAWPDPRDKVEISPCARDFIDTQAAITYILPVIEVGGEMHSSLQCKRIASKWVGDHIHNKHVAIFD